MQVTFYIVSFPVSFSYQFSKFLSISLVGIRLGTASVLWNLHLLAYSNDLTHCHYPSAFKEDMKCHKCKRSFTPLSLKTDLDATLSVKLDLTNKCLKFLKLLSAVTKTTSQKLL